jgi:polyisoprenoid-binding protein YceI
MSATMIEQPASASTRWTLDQEGTSVEFSVKTFWGLATVHGRFDRFEGSYEIGPDGMKKIDLTIDADSLDTGNNTRDNHLRSEDFFFMAAHPRLQFTSTRVHDVGNGLLHIVGDLEAAGTVVQVEFPAELKAVDGGLELEATTAVDQARFGMSSGRLGMIRRPTTLHVKARLNE